MTAVPDDDTLAEWERLADAATEGPWYVVGPPWNDREPYIIAGDQDPHYGHYLADLANLADDSNAANNEHADATFITAARTAVPALIAALRCERAENQRLRDALTFVREFIAVGGNGEGWTFEHVDAVAGLALRTDVSSRARMLARGVMGSEWIRAALSARKAGTDE